MAGLDEQVARLERKLRLQQALTLAALAVALLSAIASFGWTREVRARAFLLVNEDGKELARLGLTPRGAPILKLVARDNAGSVLVGSLGEDLAGFAVASDDGQSMISLATEKNGKPSLGLTAKRRKAILGVGEDREPTLLMYGDPGVLAATSSYVRLKDPSGKTVFSTTPDGAPPAGAQ